MRRLRLILEEIEQLKLNQRKIMATQGEIVAQLKAQKETIDALNAKEAAQTVQLQKVLAEVKALKDAVNSGNLDDIKAAADAVGASVATLVTTSEAGHTATQAVDDENTDAP